MENNLEPYNDQSFRNKFQKEEAYLRAQKKVKSLVGFYWHLASYIIVNLFIIIILVSNGVDFFSFGTFATAFFWGIGLFFHFLGVFGADFLFGKSWEERKIKKYMEKERQRWE